MRNNKTARIDYLYYKRNRIPFLAVTGSGYCWGEKRL